MSTMQEIQAVCDDLGVQLVICYRPLGSDTTALGVYDDNMGCYMILTHDVLLGTSSQYMSGLTERELLNKFANRMKG